jgi:Protein of unknown function (DUF2630)
MNDNDVLQSIDSLMNEEHALLKRAEHTGLSDEEHARLNTLKVSLDQCWDLLRQRRARREFGENPNEAKVRDANTVEGYKQ